MLVITEWWFRAADAIWQMTVCGWRWSANNVIYRLIISVIQNWQKIEEIGYVDVVDEMMWHWAHLKVICACDEWDERVICNCKSKLVFLLRLGYLKPFLVGSKKPGRLLDEE